MSRIAALALAALAALVVGLVLYTVLWWDQDGADLASGELDIAASGTDPSTVDPPITDTSSTPSIESTEPPSVPSAPATTEATAEPGPVPETVVIGSESVTVPVDDDLWIPVSPSTLSEVGTAMTVVDATPLDSEFGPGLRVRFIGPTPDCLGSSPVLVESATVVSIGVQAGPMVGNRGECEAVALPQEMVVPLAAPVGDREVRFAAA